jgi:hypothetical protein
MLSAKIVSISTVDPKNAPGNIFCSTRIMRLFRNSMAATRTVQSSVAKTHRFIDCTVFEHLSHASGNSFSALEGLEGRREMLGRPEGAQHACGFRE